MFLAILFLMLAAVLFFKLIGFFFRAVFGVGSLIFSLIFWPVVLLILFFGIFKFLLPILVIGGIILLVIGLLKRNGGSAGSANRDYVDVDYREKKM